MSRGTTRCTQPSSWQRRASYCVSPQSVSSSAEPSPIWRVSGAIQPAPPMFQRASAMPTLASSDMIRMSHCIAYIKPPATAQPLIAAMVGFQRLSVSDSGTAFLRRLGTCTGESRPSRSASRVSAVLIRSAPAQKARPAPVSTAQRALGSSRYSTKAS